MTRRPAATGARIVGVDVARGLAVLGMFGAHVGLITAWDWADPSTWWDAVNGRSSILFATLAGVSLALMSGRTTPVTGADLRAVRLRILVRAAAVFVIGALLELLGTDVAVILPYYALLFVIGLPLLTIRPLLLFALAGLVAVVAPVLVQLMTLAVADASLSGASGFLIELLFTGYYPVLVWSAFLMAGLAVGRLDLSARRVHVQLLSAGAALAVLGYGSVPLLEPIAAPFWDPLVTSAPHSGSPFEVVGSTGVAIGVLALCLLVTGPARPLLFPVAAVGSMALTVYSVQVFAIAVLDPVVRESRDNWLWLWFTLGALVGASVWAVFLGRGPVERLLTRLSARAALPRIEP